MGKETKIGLAVIGVLLVVFGALLVRKLNSIGNDQMAHQSPPAPLQPLAARGVEQPQGTQAAAAAPTASESAWAGTAGQQTAALAGTDQATAMEPADASAEVEGRYAQSAANDRYATEPAQEYAAEEPAGVGAATSTSPFQRRPGTASATVERYAEPTAAEPAPLPHEPESVARLESRPTDSGRRSKNPLRRLSAEVPIEGDPTGVEAEPAAQPAFEIEPAAPTDAEPTFSDSAVEAEAEPYQAEPAEVDEPSAEEPIEDGPADRYAVEPQVEPESRYAPRRSIQPVEEDAADDEPPASQPRWRHQSAEERPLPAGGDMPQVENGQYTVQPNDNLWVISEKVYGTGGYFKALREHNRDRLANPDRLTVGSRVAVPAATLLEQNYPSLCPKRRKSAVVQSTTIQASARQRRSGGGVYVVEEGDTLFDIARYELGKASRWAEIYDLNREVLGEDFDYLRPGLELTLPEKSSGGDAVTRRPGGGYQR